MNIAVLDSGGNLVAFLRMDDAQLASISICRAQGARCGPIPPSDQGARGWGAKADLKYLLTLDDVIASRGGIPLIEDGKIIGAIGCSGGTGSQDEVICMAGAALVNK